MAAIGAALGYLLPDLWLNRKTKAMTKAIENGLPDALDLHHRLHRSGFEP